MSAGRTGTQAPPDSPYGSNGNTEGDCGGGGMLSKEAPLACGLHSSVTRAVSDGEGALIASAFSFVQREEILLSLHFASS